jgi:hypothetical protein
MSEIFRGLIWKELVAYIDDICSFGQDIEQSLTRLATVMKRLRAANMKVKASKCKLLKKLVKFLGFLISRHGVTLDNEKMEAINRMKIPESKEELHTFLGLLVYYSAHIPDYARKTEPLWKVMRKRVSFVLDDHCLSMIKVLKEDLISPRVLCFPNWDLTFEIHTDASRVPGALGVVLLQRSQETGAQERVIGFYSRMLH